MPPSSLPDLVVLAGGRGSRIAATGLPKPIVPVDGTPLTVHVQRTFRSEVASTTIVTGDRAEEVERTLAAHLPAATVSFLRTAPELGSGARIARAAEGRTRPFVLAWCDGLADVDVEAMLAVHAEQDATVTALAVRPTTRFGVLELLGDRVAGYVEKPVLDGVWVSGGVFVVDPTVAALVDGDDTSWERDVLPCLAADGSLAALRHDRFWMCVDTPKDLAAAAELASSGAPPWQSS